MAVLLPADRENTERRILVLPLQREYLLLYKRMNVSQICQVPLRKFGVSGLLEHSLTVLSSY